MRNNCSQTGNSLIDYLNELHDTRKSRGKRHSLALCIVLLFLGLMDNVCSVRGTAKYIHSPFRKKELTEVLTPYFDLSHGLPEYSTLNRVLCDVPKEELATLLCLWSVDLIYGDAAQIVWGVDGQAIRAACNKALTGKNLYMVDYYSIAHDLILYMAEVGNKTNEARGIVDKLPGVISEGDIFFSDAMGTKRDILEVIQKARAGFVVPLKSNNPRLSEKMMQFLEKQNREGSSGMDHFVDLNGCRPDAGCGVVIPVRCTVEDEDNLKGSKHSSHPISSLELFPDIHPDYINLDSEEGQSLLELAGQKGKVTLQSSDKEKNTDSEGTESKESESDASTGIEEDNSCGVADKSSVTDPKEIEIAEPVNDNSDETADEQRSNGSPETVSMEPEENFSSSSVPTRGQEDAAPQKADSTEPLKGAGDSSVSDPANAAPQGNSHENYSPIPKANNTNAANPNATWIGGTAGEFPANQSSDELPKTLPIILDGSAKCKWFLIGDQYILLAPSRDRYERREIDLLISPIDDMWADIPEKIRDGWGQYIVTGALVTRYRATRARLADKSGTGWAVTVTRTPYILSYVPDSAEEIGMMIRNYWGVESKLHYVVDTIGKGDRCTARTGNSPQNNAILRKLQFNVLSCIRTRLEKDYNIQEYYSGVMHLIQGQDKEILKLLTTYAPKAFDDICSTMAGSK